MLGSYRLIAARITLLISVMLPSFGAAAQAASHSIQITEIKEFIQLQGLVEAAQQATVSAQVAGRVNQVLVDVGEEVAAGSPIVTITALEHDHAVSQAQAEVAAWQVTFDLEAQELARISRLTEQGLASTADLDRAKTRFDHAQAQLQGAQAALARSQEQLSYTVVKAPYSGIVSARWVEPGELVQPGTPLMSGFSPHHLRVHVDIPSTYGAFVKAHQQASVHDAELARVTLFPTIDSASGTLRLRLDVAAGSDLIPGQWVPVRVQVAAHSGIQIPRQAVQQRGELQLVKIKDHGWRAVRLGTQEGDWVEIISGLQAGEVIEYEH